MWGCGLSLPACTCPCRWIQWLPSNISMDGFRERARGSVIRREETPLGELYQQALIGTNLRRPCRNGGLVAISAGLTARFVVWGSATARVAREQAPRFGTTACQIL